MTHRGKILHYLNLHLKELQRRLSNNSDNHVVGFMIAVILASIAFFLVLSMFAQASLGAYLLASLAIPCTAFAVWQVHQSTHTNKQLPHKAISKKSPQSRHQESKPALKNHTKRHKIMNENNIIPPQLSGIKQRLTERREILLKVNLVEMEEDFDYPTEDEDFPIFLSEIHDAERQQEAKFQQEQEQASSELGNENPIENSTPLERARARIAEKRKLQQTSK